MYVCTGGGTWTVCRYKGGGGGLDKKGGDVFGRRLIPQ